MIQSGLATCVRYHTVTSLATELRSFSCTDPLPVPSRATIQRVSATRKPVIVRKLTRDWSAGYADSSPSADTTELELLDNSGKLVKIAWNQVKWVCYVRELASVDGSSGSAAQPERLLRRRFSSRPRTAGLWLRLLLTDGDELEGVAANDRSLLDGPGLLLTPPDTRSNTQRIYVPRTAIRELTVLGVLHPSAPRRGTGAQPALFEIGAADPMDLDLSSTRAMAPAFAGNASSNL